MYRKFLFLTTEAFRTIRRHKGVTAISVVIMSLSLLMLAVFLLATDNVLRYIGEAQRDMKLYVYLEDGVGNRGVQRLHNGVMAMDEVAQVVFISKDEALADFRVQLAEDADLLDALQANPLPNSFWVTPQEQHKNQTSMAYLAGKIIQLEGVEDVRYGKDFLERFTAIVKGIYYVDIIVGLLVITSAIFIISNAVRLTVISRKRNIKILKLVGATNRFITMPFIIEGALQGGMAALISLVLVFGVTLAGRQVVPDLHYFSFQKAAIYTSVCIAIGSIGSFAALRHYLKV